MKRVPATSLLPGMVTGEDVFSVNEQLLLPKGSGLTDGIISTLGIYGVLSILIQDAEKTEEKATPFSTYSQRIKNSPEFKRFKKNYDREVATLSEKLNLVVSKNMPLDVNELYCDTIRILEDTTSGANVFDMLHNMREYDSSTFAHSLNVALICHVMADWMNLSEEETEIATTCGLLHDIGKLLVPHDIIVKPGKLSDTEFDIIKKHPLSGYQLLLNQNVNPEIFSAALMHHERCDGSGYPMGLEGDQISRYAKMVSIADVYDAMTASRVYRGALCPFKVIDLFQQEGLQKYDPDLILTFLENVVNTYISNSCRLTDGREGTIIYINKHDLAHPIVQCGHEYVNLSEHKDLHVACLL